MKELERKYAHIPFNHSFTSCLEKCILFGYFILPPYTLDYNPGLAIIMQVFVSYFLPPSVQ